MPLCPAGSFFSTGFILTILTFGAVQDIFLNRIPQSLGLSGLFHAQGFPVNILKRDLAKMISCTAFLDNFLIVCVYTQ